MSPYAKFMHMPDFRVNLTIGNTLQSSLSYDTITRSFQFDPGRGRFKIEYGKTDHARFHR
jgi:hypothetical protein